MPTKRSSFLDNYQKALDEGNAALFVGAGLSVPAGYVNWKELLRTIAEELDLDIDAETDLVALAQYHVNQTRGREGINQKIVDEFTKDAQLSDNHRLIATLPVPSVWTTNYDPLLEEAFKAAHKRVDVKIAREDLAITKPKRDVIVYKMHGDVTRPGDAVLTKDDYERYNEPGRRQLFSIQLQGDLVSKTFLFLGFSFTDPNIGYILGRVRALVGESRRPHYWVTRDAQTFAPPDRNEIKHQKYRIEDLETYGIQTVLVESFAEITEILRELCRRVHRKNVFVSGSAADFGPLGQARVEGLARRIGAAIIDKGFNLVSGLGVGIGDAVSMGAIEVVYRSAASHLDERTVLRPFPQTEPERVKRAAIWRRYREEMIGRSRSAIYLLGNKVDKDSGAIVPADGMREEFAIATENGVYPVPVGMSGHLAADLWKEVRADLTRYYGEHAKAVEAPFNVLNDAAATDDDLIAAIVRILQIIAPR